MKALTKLLVCLLTVTIGIDISFARPVKDILPRYLANQTDDLSPVLPSTGLPFQVVIEQANFLLPVGFHSGVVGVYKGLWVFIAGRINGMHGFDHSGGNFPPNQQNTSIFVVNPATGLVASRSLYDPSSGLTQQQIDNLSVTSPQGYQEVDTLFMTGGYGIDTASGTFGTKPILTAFNLPGIVAWVTQPGNPSHSVAKNIRQLSNPVFQITGGQMFKLGNVTQLVFGQSFNGEYTGNDDSIQEYSKQIRPFQIKNVNGQLLVNILPAKPTVPEPNFRRRDLNVLPALLNNNNQLEYGLIAYAGVFTLADGVWTVPVVINSAGDPKMADPNSPTTFKQAMNQYICATASLYSRKSSSMYHIFFGGISFGYFQNGVFTTDAEIPFINQVTTIQMDKNGQFSQYLMNNQYPTILSTGSNPGNPLLFGAGAYFMANPLQQYANGVINLDNIREPTVLGYIVGGIQSTLANTNTISDSTASPYVFKVTLVPTAALGTQGKSSKSASSVRATPQEKPVLHHVVSGAQKSNHRHRESSSQETLQSRHLA